MMTSDVGTRPSFAKRLVRAGLIGGLYAVLTVLPPFSSISYGPIQVRVSEALTVLPYFTTDAVYGLWLGCVVANLASPFLVWDITLGAGATLVAGYLTHLVSRTGKPYLAPLPPVLVNATVVSFYVARLSGLPYLPVAANIALGEGIACYLIGYPVLAFVARNPFLRKFLGGNVLE